MEIILILISWLILLVPGFDNSVPPTGDKVFKIEIHPDIVESMKIHSDDSLDFWGFVIELKPNSTGTLELKIPKNLPTPASFMHSSWYNDEKPFVLVDGDEVIADVIEDPCNYQYNIPIENNTSFEIVYPVIAAGTWKLYSPIEFDEDHPCYYEVFDENQINPPLQQYHSGIPFDEIKCKQNLVLVQKYNGAPACVTESTKQKLIERGWTENSLSSPDSTMQTDTGSNSKTSYNVIITYDTDNDRGRQLSIDPHNVIVDLEEKNTVVFVNNGSTPVNIFDSLKGTWSFDNVKPSSKQELIINSTGFHEFLIQDSREGETGTIVALSENTDSLPVETRAKMAQSIVSGDFDNGVGLIGVGSGGAEPGISIDIDKKFQDKYSLEFYYERYTEMIPFNVPMTIEFSEPFTFAS